MSTGGAPTPEAISRIGTGPGEFSSVGVIDEYKVLEYNDAKNVKTPRLSGNSKVYIIVNANNEIKQITMYEDHGLSREIGFENPKIGIHAHSWMRIQTPKGEQIVRDNSEKHAHLSDDEKTLVNRVIEYVIDNPGLFWVDKRLVNGKRGVFY